jgi:hypothetical protein
MRALIRLWRWLLRVRGKVSSEFERMDIVAERCESTSMFIAEHGHIDLAGQWSCI